MDFDFGFIPMTRDCAVAEKNPNASDRATILKVEVVLISTSLPRGKSNA